MPLRIPNVPVDAEELDVLYFDPLLPIEATLRSGKPLPDRDLGYRLLKTVTVSTLTVTGGKHIIPLARGEDRPGRFFDVAPAKTVNGIRYVGERGGYDYHNQPPFTSGRIRDSFTVGQTARIPLAAHLYDPDGRAVRMEIIPPGDVFGRQAMPPFAALQGTDLVVDTSVPRASTTVAVRLTDEKNAVAVLDVTFDVVTPSAPAAPGPVEYVALVISELPPDL